MARPVLIRCALVAAACAAAAPAGAAAIGVTTTAESPGVTGDCTLGEAIEAAHTDAAVDACEAGSGPDTITVPAGTYTLTSGTTTAAGRSAFVVTSSVAIAGSGATLTLDPAVTNLRFFEVTSAGTLTLDGLTLLAGIARGANGVHAGLPGSQPTPGAPGRGGAVHNAGTLILRDALLKKNQAIGGRGGDGGNMSGGPSGRDGGVGQGGALYNTGVVTVERATFLQNDATGGAGGHGAYEAGPGIGGAAEGGGIHNTAAGTVSIADSDFTANRALGGRTGFSGTSGLSPDPGGPADGGGIFTRGSVSLTRTSMTWHQAVGGTANVPGTARGGAVAVLGGTLTIMRGAINDNNATGGPRSHYYPRPTGSALGGALYVQSAVADVQGTSIARNTAIPGVGTFGPGTAHGGGVELATATLTATNTTFSANWAPNGGGGARADASSTLTLRYATVVQNSSSTAPGGIVVAGGPTTLSATIVAHNGAGNCQGPVTDGGSNMQYLDGTCGSIPVMDPMVGPREESGGTVFHPLLPGSPARDGSGVLPCPSEDQRGVARPLDGDGDGVAACDIGAIEADDAPAPGDLIFADGFESGDMLAWSGSASDGGDLAVTTDAALAGTYGLRATVDDAAPLYVRDDSPGDENRYRARFHLDPSAFDPGTASGTFRTRVFIGFDESPQRRVFAVVLRKQTGAYSLMVRSRLDDDTQVDTAFFPIAAGAHAVEIDWRRATGPDANDGGVQLWIDGASVADVTGLDNATSGIDFVRLGAQSVKAGASGQLDFDAFESRRQTYIGP